MKRYLGIMLNALLKIHAIPMVIYCNIRGMFAEEDMQDYWIYRLNVISIERYTIMLNFMLGTNYKVNPELYEE